MEDLKPLFKKRDKSYSKQSRKFLKLIDTTLVCVTEYLTTLSPDTDQGTISWEDISYMDGMIVIMGMVLYEVGDNASFSDTQITVTQDNIHELEHMVHMAVPINLVEADNAEEITQYLQSLGGINVDAETSFIPLPSAVMENQDFDLTELTEEQLEKLKLSSL